jgi:glycosyltransferase involved in cell wall biosynthesis
MASRVSGTPVSQDSPSAVAAAAPAPPESGPALGTRLAAEARSHLTVSNLDGYRGLFQRATETDDPHARYHARVRLIEEGLAAARQASTDAQATQRLVAVAEMAVDVLEEEPREPVLLNYAALALYGLWSLDSAQALFEAVHRLDAGHPQLEHNLAELGRRRRELARGGHPVKLLHPAVAGLAVRARALSHRARPAEGMTLSLCMIVRDEEEMLPRCLAAVAPAVDEIVIVDTGSTDRTIEIAKSFGAKVIEREWTGSFADARNVALEATTGDWVIHLDADEVLVAEDADRLRALTGRVWREAFRLVETSYTGEAAGGSATITRSVRVLRNRPQYRFQGRLHEQITAQLPGYASGRIEQSSVRIDHYGYLSGVREAKEKSQRNLELLRAQQAESGSSAFLHFNLGAEYGALGDYDSAVSELEQAWHLVQSREEDAGDWLPAAVQRLVSGLISCGRAEEAIARAQDGLRLFPRLTDLVFRQAEAALSLGREAEAIELLNRCIEMGDAPIEYWAAVGTGTFLARAALAEICAGRGQFDLVQDLLDQCLRERPGFAGFVGPYATVLLRNGVAPDDVVEEIEARIAEVTPSVRSVLATVLYRHGAMAAAETQCRAVLTARPSNSEVRVQLAETLLNQGRYLDAAAEVSGIAPDDRFARLASRIELWGRIAGGDLTGARQAAALAANAGVCRHELEMFEGWMGLAAGAQEARSLPVVATPLLGVILESLLRVHDFETFELLTGLLGRSALPLREQRELLAGMYFDHGFLASAAQEWMAVCESEPDARALLGLSRVASANGQLEDAAVFAAEALKHDPASSVAREILDRCPPAHDLLPVRAG